MNIVCIIICVLKLYVWSKIFDIYGERRKVMKSVTVKLYDLPEDDKDIKTLVTFMTGAIPDTGTIFS